MTTFNSCASAGPEASGTDGPKSPTATEPANKTDTPPSAEPDDQEHHKDKDKDNNDDDHSGRMQKIKKLKAKLINEEHRLVLMKKIRQSQTRPAPAANQAGSGGGATALLNNGSNQTNTNQGGNQLKKLRSQHSNSSINNNNPLALHKNHSSSGLLNSSSSSPSTTTTNASMNQAASPLNQTPAHAHQRPKVNTLWNPPPQQARHPTPIGTAAPHVGNLSRQPITTPPNVVQAMMGNLTGQQSLLLSAAAAQARRPQQPQQHTSSSSSSSPGSLYNKSQANQMLLNKNRSTFKQSLQKQLEQTLLQQQQQQQSQKNLSSQSAAMAFSNSTTNLSNKRSAGISSPHVGNLSRQPITTPPNVVQDMRSGGSGEQSLLMNANNLSSSSRRATQQQHPISPSFKSQAAQMLLQKRTAAKSAIQKQLEQTITQLPQKHIQVGIDFVPNPNNIEFVYYIGLEACVDYLTGTKNPLDVHPLKKPFECSTCGTDFTPAWSWKRSNAVCENCVSEHVKKSLKNSQAVRIKSILSKAAKQEQDMDQRIIAEAANVVSAPSPSSSSSQQHSLLQTPSHHQAQVQQPRSTPQLWPPRVNTTPLTTANTTRSSNVPVAPAVNLNLLAGMQPALASSLLQLSPQLSTLMSSMMSATNNANSAPPTNNSNNQLAQVAALLMNQLNMNLWKR